MKSLKVLFPLLVFALMFTACEQDSDDTDLQTTTEVTEDLTDSEDVQESEGLYFEELVAETAANSVDCPTITWDQPRGTYPNTVTIDFGASCEGPNGHTRSGQVVITMTDKLMNAGAVHTTTLQDYFIDGVQILGTHVKTNGGENANGQPYWTKDVIGGGLIFPDGTSISFESSYVRTQVEGYDTDMFRDDVFTLEGSKTGTNRNGVNFSSVILEPLVISRDCRWITSGIIQYTFDANTRTVDFGDGTCDRLATVTLPNGDTKTIRLRGRWHN